MMNILIERDSFDCDRDASGSKAGKLPIGNALTSQIVKLLVAMFFEWAS